MRPKLLTLCIAAPLLLAACAVLSTGAQAATVGGITPSFTPDRAGAGTAFTLAMGFSQEQGGVPEPVTNMVIHLPAGLGIDVRGVSTCPKALLERHAGRGCPASARVGGGSARMGAHLGATNLDESAALTAWRGPNQAGHTTLEILGHGLTPLDEHVTITGVLEPDRAPYSQKLVMKIPPIPTLTGEANASVLRSTVTIGSAHGRLGRLMRVPRSCPAGGFPFAADFSYADATSSSATATVHCP